MLYQNMYITNLDLRQRDIEHSLLLSLIRTQKNWTIFLWKTKIVTSQESVLAKADYIIILGNTRLGSCTFTFQTNSSQQKHGIMYL